MDLEPLAQKMKDFIESELGLWTEVRHNGNGYSFYPISPTGRILGETRIVVTHARVPAVFMYSRGYFTGREGMALASRFRNILEQESKPQEEVFELTQDMRIDTASAQIDPENLLVYPFAKENKKVEESLN